MRPISHGSTGICGSRHWAHGENIPSCPERKCVYFRTIATYSVFLSKIRSRRSRHDRCARCFGNTGLHPWLRKAGKTCGGDGNSSAFMHQRSNVTAMATSARSKCPTCSRVSEAETLTFLDRIICVNCSSTASMPSSHRDNRTCHALHRPEEWTRSTYKCLALKWRSGGA